MIERFEKILTDNGYTPNHKGFYAYLRKTPTYKWIEEIIKELGYVGDDVKVYTTNTACKYANCFTLNGGWSSRSYFDKEVKSELIFNHIMGIKPETYNRWLTVINQIDKEIG